mgnify:CR=1 FL=1
MSDQLSLSKFIGFCLVTLGIILICVVLGGYTSFWRAQNRIKASIEYLTDACNYRVDLLPGFIEMAKKSEPQVSILELTQTIEKAKNILQQVIPQKKPLENNLIKELEISQEELTRQLKDLFPQLEISLDKKDSQQFKDLKNEFISLQDHLFVTRKRYNDEVDYFITRTIEFPSSVFAKLFGFNKLNYIKISEDVLLPYQVAFAPETP